MIPEIRVDGARQLAQVSRALKTASPALRRELADGIREGTEPVKREAMAELSAVLPIRGGASAQIPPTAKVVTQRLGGRASPGLRLRATSPGARRNLQAIDRGILRHPLFGNRDHWFTTRVPPGWFSRPTTAAMPRLRKVLVDRMNTVARKIGR